MLVEFKVRNFRSFKDEASLSMLPVNAYKEHLENIIPKSPVSANAGGVLSAAAIYGANASGKTNLLRAIKFTQAIVTESNAGTWRTAPNAFAGQEDEPTELSFSIISKGTRYRYELSIDSRGVSREALFAQPKSERLVFERRALKGGEYEVKQGSRYSGIAAKLKGYAGRGPIIGMLSRFGVEACVDVYDWFEGGLLIRDASLPIGYDRLLAKLRSLGEEGFSKAIDAVKEADLGITGAQLTIRGLTDEEREGQKVMTDKVRAIFEIITGEKMDDVAEASEKIVFQFRHSIDGKGIGFGFEGESLGTVAMLDLAADIIDATENGKLLIVDEIENSLHPILLRKLVALFSDQYLNDEGAQLVFTTHELSIMDADILRRDQYWFTEKDPESGSSILFPLSAYSPRKDDSILNRYLYGAYGAVPFVDGILR